MISEGDARDSLKFQKCGEFFFCAHNETFSVPVSAGNPDPSPFGIHG
jgi:hypothetical protein